MISRSALLARLVTDEQTNEQTNRMILPLPLHKALAVCCVGSDCMRWISYPNTNVPNTQQVSATSLQACQAACIANTQCNGIDWTAAGTQCRLSVPASGVKNIGGASGTTHYDLSRDCEVQGNNDVINLQC